MQSSASPFAAKAFFRALKCLRPAGISDGFKSHPSSRGRPLWLCDSRTTLQPLRQGTSLTPRHAFDPALLPTLLQLEGLFRSAKQGKAPGRAFLPIFLKSHFRLTEPVQFKSTTLIALFKGKGSPAVLANHRAIALLDGPGKALRRSMRPAFVALLPSPDQQQGGTPGSLLAGAHHLVRAHQQLALGLKVPAVALFLDVSSAYYRVLRQAFGRGPLENDEDVARLLALLKVQGAPGIVRTRAGSRLGDSVADLLFSLVQADFLRSVREQTECLADTDPVLGSVDDGPSSVVPVWADDAANLLAQRSTPQLIAAAQLTLSVCGSLRIYPGAPDARQEVYIRQAGLLHFQARGEEFQVHCVRAYTHLGGRVCVTGRFMADIAQHHSYVWAQVRPLARQVLRNPTLPFAKRRLILNSLAFSAASCAAATWGPLNGQESRAWRVGYVRLVRPLGRDDRHTGQPSLPAEVDVCRAFRFASPVAYLRAERILHDFPEGFAEYALHAPSTLRMYEHISVSTALLPLPLPSNFLHIVSPGMVSGAR
ncbi:unnamed protein product, partial [Symbiodinium pilosum]